MGLAGNVTVDQPAGGRVLGITATGSRLDLALTRCYEAIADIDWDGMHYRRDIGRNPELRARVV